MASIMAAGAGLSLLVSGGAAAQETLPAVKFLSAPLVSPSAAQSYYASSTTHTFGLSANPAFNARAPELVELARALKNDPDLIFEYVHNQIQTEFAFGLRKGSLSALINRYGTPFDQNQLFVDLVRQAGYTARFQIGQVTVSGTDFANWTGVSDIQAACRLLSSGGIPAAFNGASASPADCSQTGSLTSVTLLHAWSEVQIGGVWYAYDPSFKLNKIATPRNLWSTSGFTSQQTSTTAAATVDSGSSSGSNYIHNANNAGLDSYLTARSTQLAGDLRTNAFSQDTASVLGLPKIAAAYKSGGGWRANGAPTSLGASTATAESVSAQTAFNDIPDGYRTKLEVNLLVSRLTSADTAHTAFDQVLFVDEFDGRRLMIDTNWSMAGQPNSSTAQYTNQIVSLTVDDVALQSYTLTPPTGASVATSLQASGYLTLTATHPYAANGGTYANQTVTKAVQLTLPLAIMTGWGEVSPALTAKWGAERRTDTPSPAESTPPSSCGGTQGDICYPMYPTSNGDLTRATLAANWLSQLTRMLDVQAAVGGGVAQHHHSLGVVAARYILQGFQINPQPAATDPIYYTIRETYASINVDSAISVVSKTNAPTAPMARAMALAASTLEGSVLEQTENLPDTASTAARFAWGNAPDNEDPCFTTSNPRRFFDFTGSTGSGRSANYQYEGSASGCGAAPTILNYTPQNWISNAESVISSYLAAGFNVTASGETFLGPGARFGPGSNICSTFNDTTYCIKSHDPSRQRGAAVIATQYDGSGNVLAIAHTLSNIDGISKGGGVKQPELAGFFDPSKAADVLKDKFVDHSAVLGVDLKSGQPSYSSPTLLSLGAGSAPYKLDASLTWKNGAEACGDYSPCTGAVKAGWNHSWDIRFSVSGSGLEGMGATSPIAGASAFTAFMAMQDVFGDPARTNLEKDVYAALVADWWRRQMIGNVATVTQGFSGKQYVKLADGSFLPPVGSPGVLVQSGAQSKVRDICRPISNGADNTSTARRWDFHTVTYQLTNAAGDVMSFAPWGWIYDTQFYTPNNCTAVYGYMPTTWTFPQGPSISFSYDYQQGVVGLTTSLGRSLSFTGPHGSTGLVSATGGGYTVGQTATTGANALQDAAGSVYKVDLLATQARSASQRPVPYTALQHVYEPVNGTQPALEYAYDSLGRVKQAKDAVALQQGTRGPYLWYIADGGRAEHDDPLGGAYTVYYDTDGNAVRFIDELSREVDTTYDGRHRVLTRVFPEQNCEQFTYDAADHVTSLTQSPKNQACGSSPITISATYDPVWGKLASITDALGNRADLTYYGPGVAGASLLANAQRPAVPDPYNGNAATRPTYSFQYNAIGLPIQETDPAGVTTTHAYDSLGNLTSTTTVAASAYGQPALNLTTSFTPDAVGNVVSAVDPRGNAITTQYDAMRRKLAEQKRNGSIIALPLAIATTTYDANGRDLTSSRATGIDGSGNATGWETVTKTYTPTGKVATVTDPLNEVTTTTYDALDRVATVTDPVGRVTSKIYDPAGQVLQERRGVGTPLEEAYTTFTYSPNGQQITEADARNNLTCFDFDGYDRAWRTRYPLTGTGAGACDNANAESFTLDANGNHLTDTRRDGQVISLAYDALNRPIVKSSPGLRSVYSVWDLAGRPKGISFDSAAGPGVSYSFDAAGRFTSEATFGHAVSVAYDASGNLASIAWPDGFTVLAGFDPLNRQASLAEQGGITLATFTYDTLSRRTGLARGNGTSAAYGYDAADRITSFSHTFPNASGSNVSYGFGWTGASQLASRTLSNAGYRWPSSQAGAQAKTYDGLNRDQAVAALSGGYDTRGNLTNDGTRAFTYDVENRLLTAALPGVSASLSYDPLGRLSSYTVNGTATQFLYLGPDLVGEYDGAWNLLRRYAHGDGVDEPLVWYEGAGTAGRRYLHADRQGSIIAWSDNTGAVQATYAYGPYGEPQGWSGSRFRYTGQIALPELQLYHYKARVYDPIAGRFLQTDPIGYKDGPDWYLYVGDDPVNVEDPAGTCGDSTGTNICLKDGGLNPSSSGHYFEVQGKPAQPQAGGSGYSTQKPTNSVSEGRQRIAEEQRTNGPERDKQLATAAVAIVGTGVAAGAAIELGVAETVTNTVSVLRRVLRDDAGRFCCFVAGTLVETKTGLRPIEAIEVGDLVLSRDAVTGRTAYKPVAELIRRHDREIYRLVVQVSEQGGVRTDVFETTDDHPWRTAANEWRRTVDLRPGDLVQRSEGAPAVVVSVEHTTRKALTYNLEVADFHSYFVGEGRLWVHNTGCSEDPPPPYKVGGPKPDPLKGTRSSTGAPPPRAPPKKEEHWLVKLIRMINKAEETAAHH